mgnify:CR=1 FL=1
MVGCSLTGKKMQCSFAVTRAEQREVKGKPEAGCYRWVVGVVFCTVVGCKFYESVKRKVKVSRQQKEAYSNSIHRAAVFLISAN